MYIDNASCNERHLGIGFERGAIDRSSFRLTIGRIDDRKPTGNKREGIRVNTTLPAIRTLTMSDTANAHEAPKYDLSVVMCTRNRAASLGQTLDSLVKDERSGVQVEVVVVDNGSTDDTRKTALSYGGDLDIRYLREERPGKSHALNRALDEGQLGRIVAFLDDDMSIEKGWIKGVVKSCERWPEHDIFSGRSHAIFPQGETIPQWAYNKQFHGWAFSVADPGAADRPLRRGSFPSGNHFWVRSRALVAEPRFPPLWLTEPGFVLGLQQAGYGGVWIGDVAVGHRVQPHLLDPKVILGRMAQFGKDFPFVRLANYNVFWHARMFRAQPTCWVALCMVNSLRWYLILALSSAIPDSDRRFMSQIRSTVRFYDNWSTIRNWRRIRQFVSTPQHGAGGQRHEASPK